MFYFFCCSVFSKTPITDFLESSGPCDVCNSIGNKIMLNKERKTKSELRDDLLKYCHTLDKYEDGACSIIVKSNFDSFYLSNNNSETCSYLCNKDVNAQKRPKISPKNNARHPEALSTLDCNICEMVVGFALEQGSAMVHSNTGKIFREKCSKVELYKKYCNIFTDDVANQMVNHLTQNIHPFEMCLYFGYCQ